MRVPTSLPRPLHLLLCLGAVAAQYAPAAVSATLTPNGTAVAVTWGASGAPAAAYVIQVSPYAFNDPFSNAYDTGWVWSNPGAVGSISAGLTSGQVVISLTSSTTLGGNAGGGTAAFLTRPETFDARVDFCVSVHVDVKTVRVPDSTSVGGQSGGVAITDPTTGVVLLARWVQATATCGFLCPGLFPPTLSYARGGTSNGVSVSMGTPLAVTAGAGYVGLCWSWRTRAFSSYSRTSASDAWTLEGSWSALALDGGAAAYGVRHPQAFRVGIIGLTTSNSPSSGNRNVGYSDFNLVFGTSTMGAPPTDPVAVPFTVTVTGGATSAIIAPPPFFPFSYAVAARGAQGTAASAFVPAAPALGLAAAPPGPPTLPLPAATLAAAAYAFHWDFSRERPGGAVPLVGDASPNRNLLLAGAGGAAPTIAAAALGPWNAWAAAGDSFLDAVPYMGATWSGGSAAGGGGALNLNTATDWALFVVLRLPGAGAGAGAIADVLNKGPSAGDTTRPGYYVTARGGGGAGGAPAVNMVVRALGGAPDSVNSAGVTLANSSASGVTVLTFRSHGRGPVCQGRILEGYLGTQYGFGAPLGVDAPEAAWPPPASVGAPAAAALPGWVSGAPDTDGDHWFRVAMEAAGGAPGASCTPAGGWTYQQPTNADAVRLGASSVYNGNGATNRLTATVFEVAMLLGGSSPYGVNASDVAAVESYLVAKYFAKCPAATNPSVTVAAGAATCAAGGAAVDTACSLACSAAGAVVVAGATSVTCANGRWATPGAAGGGAPAVCRPTCPPLPSPPALASCVQTRWGDPLAALPPGDPLFGRELAPYSVAPFSLPAVASPFALGGGGAYLVADTSGRRTAPDSAVALYQPGAAWVAAVTGATPLTVGVALRTFGGRAGVGLRVTEDGGRLTYYRLMLTPPAFLGGADGAVALERVVQGVPTPLVLPSPLGAGALGLLAGAWANVSLALSAGGAFSASVGGQPLFAGVVDPAGLLPHGGAALVADAGGVAHFASLTVTTACDVSGVVSGAVGGYAAVAHACLPGYAAVSGNGTRACGAGGNWSGAPLVCAALRPALNASSLAMAVPENAPAGLAVGAVRATSSASSLYFAITAGNGAGIFAIDACSGVVTLLRAGVLDYTVPALASFSLNITAEPLGDASNAVFGVLAITVTQVPRVPACVNASYAGNVTEVAAAGAVVTAAGAGGGAPLLLRLVQSAYPCNWSVTFASPPSPLANTAAAFVPVVSAGGASATLRLNQSSNGLDVLDFEKRPSVTLTVTVTNAAVPSLVGQCIVVLGVTNVNEAPVLGPAQVFTVNEAAAFSASAAAPAAVNPGAVAYADQDVGDAATFSVVGVWGGLLSDGSAPALAPAAAAALVAVSPATGALTLVGAVVPSSPTAARTVGAYLTRAAYTVAVRVVDRGGLADVKNITLLVLVSSVTGGPTLSGISPSQLLPTANGTALVVSGANLGNVSAAAAIVLSYGPYTATGCAPAAASADGSVPARILCTSVPGVGAALPVTLTVGGSPVWPTTAVTLSYAPPSLTGITGVDPAGAPAATNATGNPAAASTAGGDVLWLVGANLGPGSLSGSGCSAVNLTFGPPGAEGTFAVAPAACTPTSIRFVVPPGYGAGLAFSITVGGQTAITNPATAGLSYGLPTVLAVSAPAGAPYTSATLPTAGAGASVVISGLNFGPYFAAAPGNASAAAALTPVVTAGYTSDPAAARYTLTNCLRPATAAAHTTMTCVVPPGVGASLGVAVALLGQQGPVGAPPAARISFRAPVISAISGPGAYGGTTAGGQAIVVTGTGFGPAAEAGVVNVSAVGDTRAGRGACGLSYGSYAAAACAVVVDDTTIACTSSAGTGGNHSWSLFIAGQAAATPPATAPQTYGAPAVFSFGGDGAAAGLTTGGQTVFVYGANFGAAWGAGNASGSASYAWSAGAGGAGRTYVALGCVVATPHTALACTTAPGVGQALAWTVVVDGLVSAAATTSYARPRVDNVTLADGATPVTRGAGGVVVLLSGAGFGGDGSLVDFVRVGPYACGAVTLLSDAALSCVLPPGVGAWAVVVSVAGQPSLPSAATVGYTPPSVSSVVPGVLPTNPAAGSTLTITGVGFGLDDPTAAAGVLVGNPTDGTQGAALTPTSGAVATDGSGLQVLTVAAPPGLGPNRAVAVFTYRRGTSASAPLASSSPVADTAAWSAALGDVDPSAATPGVGAFVSYLPPVLSAVSVSLPSTAADFAALAALGVSCANATSTCGYFRLSLTGTNLGRGAGAGDGVLRDVLFAAPGAAAGALAPLPSTVLLSWTDTLVVALAAPSASQVAVRVTTLSYTGAQEVVASNLLTYLSLSPAIVSLSGPASGVPTAGGNTGALLTITLRNLLPAAPVAVTVGGTAALVFDPAAPPPAAPLSSAGAGALVRGDGTATLLVQVPPGQGAGVTVIASQLEPSGDWVSSTPDAAFAVTYASPAVTAVGLRLAGTAGAALDPAQYALTAVTNASTAPPLAVPAAGGTMLLIVGTDLGLCPVVRIGPLSLAYCGNASATSGGSGAGGATVPMGPGAALSSTALAFPLPAGEGSNLAFVLSAGGQAAATGALTLSFAPPAVTRALAATPAGLPTSGGTTLLLLGLNFGAPLVPPGAGAANPYTTPGFLGSLADPAPPRVRLRLFSPADVPAALPGAAVSAATGAPFAPARDGYVVCPNVVRINDSAMTCDLPPGEGGGLDVEVTRATDAAPAVSAGVVSYDPPVVLAAACVGCGAGGGNVTVFAAVVSASGSATASPVGVGRLLVAASAEGGGTLTLTGTGFGSPRLSALGAAGTPRFCVFLASPFYAPRNASVPPPPPGTDPLPAYVPPPLLCDGVLNNGGEGELAAGAVLARNDTSVTLTLPPGVGSRLVVVSASGNPAPAPPLLRYAAPAVASMLPAQVGTDGGDVVQLAGSAFGAPLPPGVAPPLTFPLPLALAPAMPVACVVVTMDHGCVTDCVLVSGGVPAAVAACAPGIIRRSDGQIAFAAVPGVGVRKNVTVAVVDVTAATGAAVGPPSSSAAVTFSFLPPAVVAVDPSIIYVPSPPVLLSVAGAQFGRTDVDFALWTPAEQAVNMSLGGVACPAGASRVSVGASSASLLQCELPTGGLIVGGANVTVGVAGQVTTVAPPNLFAPTVACSPGYVGAPGQTCIACPVGATCAGYDSGANGTARFADPVPAPGFYNLNGSARAACPPALDLPGRAWCIVPCANPAACGAANECAVGFASFAPDFRCAACAPRYYVSGSTCAACPAAPAAQFVLLIVLAIVVIGGSFVLSKQGISVAVAAIGVDYFQVVAIFARVRVPWPPTVLTLFRVLSAFNVNLELLAPECLVPDVSFETKWGFVLALPLLIAAVFGVVYAWFVFWKAAVLRAPRDKWHTHLPALIQSEMVIVYVLYLYITWTVLDDFNCAPLVERDGNTYLQATFAACGAPGGIQQTLLPVAVIGLLVYSIGYPAALGVFLYRNRELIMEDQLLRAKGAGGDRLTNPHAYAFRKTFGRAYFQFRPDFVLWILVILLRKFLVAVVAILVNRDGGFQMAAALLVLFVAYALQVRFSPYMSPGDYEAVLAEHAAASFTSPIHARLRATLAGVEARGRKTTRKPVMTSDGRINSGALAVAVSGFLLNYNTLESTLLFSGVVVCLMGILYGSAGATLYPGSVDSITGVLLAVVILSALYYAAVLVAECGAMLAHAAAAKRRRALAKGGESGARMRRVTSAAKMVANPVGSGGGGRTPPPGAAAGAPAAGVGSKRASFRGAPPAHPPPVPDVGAGGLEIATNPLFLSGGSGVARMDGAAALEALRSQTAPPSPELWALFRDTFTTMGEQLRVAQDELAAAKRVAAEAAEAGGAASVRAARSAALSARRSAAFAPTTVSAAGPSTVQQPAVAAAARARPLSQRSAGSE